MKNLLIAITLGLTLNACGGGDTPPAKPKTTQELTKAAAAGDKSAMRQLEKQVAEKAKAEKQKMEAMSTTDPIVVFQKALVSVKGEARITELAKAGNANAQLWMAINKRSDKNLSDADKQLYRDYLQTIARHGQREKYVSLNNAKWPLSAEAAWQISEDMLGADKLYPVDTDLAIKYLKQAANEGQSQAMLKLSSRYEYGLDMDKNPTEARDWLEQSAAAGNHDAKRALKRLGKE